MSQLVAEDVTSRHGSDDPVVVVGAGPVGLAAAERLLDGGAQVVVVDRAAAVGGSSRSLDLWGHRLDLGPRAVPADAPAEALTRWLDLAGAAGGVERTRAVHRAVVGGRLLDLPLRPTDLLPPGGAVRRLARHLGRDRTTGATPAPASAWDVLVARYGAAVTREVFVPASRKRFGVHPGELPAALADELAGTPRRRGGHGEVLTAREGAGAVWAELARRLTARGARVLLSTCVEGLITDGDRVSAVRLRDGYGGHVLPARAVVAAVPATGVRSWLPGTVAPTGPAATGRDTHLVHLLLEPDPRTGGIGQDAHSVTALDASLRVGRLTTTRPWRPATSRDASRTVVCAQFWSSGDDELSVLSDEDLAAAAVAELPALGVHRGVRVLDHHVHRVPGSVPAPLPGAGGTGEAGLDRLGNLVRVARADRPGPHGPAGALLTGRALAARVPVRSR
ncbi:FAD-dependent oxidoreductase [Kineococcus aurantiacus]|uniref:Protoporphyrinogen oxidase n=1 Tax=Kineococcus aurantiacus TaxID=37633 RepID=A0A7Y9ASR6_9ACTN|nr:FAD-dependent oxidoreductase [Kineococcus aurantiacus]NYD20723.1 protoporphyrinogen oxidase [Kineococcus aurantiacus]